jgi:hypothetical protein
MTHIDRLIETTEILHSAIRSKDKEKGFEAITILLMQSVDIYGFNGDAFVTIFPFLEALKNCIESEHFDEANLRAFALMTKLRATRGFALKKKVTCRLDS